MEIISLLLDSIGGTLLLTKRLILDFLEVSLKDEIEVVETKNIYIPPKREYDYISLLIGEVEGTGEKLKLNLKENPHSYIVGSTGSGKSVLTKIILTNLISCYDEKELELYLCDLKIVELNLFKNVRQCKRFAYNIEDVTEVVEILLEETTNRFKMFMENDVTNIFEYNNIPGINKLKYQVLYIEEIVMLLEDKDKKAMKSLKRLISISRATGCYIILTTQRPSNDVIDNVVKSNISNRISLKCEDSKNSEIAIDVKGAELLRGNGHGLLKLNGTLTEFQSYYIEDEQLKYIINKYK